MIYSYKKFLIPGPNGTELTFRQDDEQTCTEIGTLDGSTYYVHVPDSTTIPEQANEIELTEVELTDQVKNQLKKLRHIEIKKQALRDEIEKIGDVYDLIADCMKMIEFTMMLTSRIAADYLETEVMDELTRQVYAQRNQAFLSAVDSGQLMIRGEYEDISSLQSRMMNRYSQINKLVKERYIDDLNHLGL